MYIKVALREALGLLVAQLPRAEKKDEVKSKKKAFILSRQLSNSIFNGQLFFFFSSFTKS